MLLLARGVEARRDPLFAAALAVCPFPCTFVDLDSFPHTNTRGRQQAGDVEAAGAARGTPSHDAGPWECGHACVWLLWPLIRHAAHPHHEQGACHAMCPAREAQERNAQGDVAKFEATDETRALRRSLRRVDPARAVKRFRRAADGRAEGPEEVRPLEWLERTVAHLWQVGREELALAAAAVRHGEAEARGPSNAGLVECYDFLADRLQAVRKDLVVQVRACGGRANG